MPARDPIALLLAGAYPDPETGEQLAAESRAVVIEDSLAGIDAARAAGLTCAAVAHTYPARELEARGAALVVPNIAELDERRLGDVYRRLYA